jgi:hypothetical protein
MVTKKTVKKTVMKRVPKASEAIVPEGLSLAKRLEESEAKLEKAMMGLNFAKVAVDMMKDHYEELGNAYEKALKHIAKLERKLEKTK